MNAATPTPVRVTEPLIREGISRDCFRCAVSLAMQAATGDPEAHVVEIDWILRLVVRGRYLVAPAKVRNFVYAYDRFPRNLDGRPKLPQKLREDLTPFDFELPPIDSPKWEESCSGCEFLFNPSELNDEGFCEECREDKD